MSLENQDTVVNDDEVQQPVAAESQETYELADETAAEADAAPGRPWAGLEESNREHVARNYATERPAPNWNDDLETLSVPPATRQTANDGFNAMPNIRVMEGDPAAAEFRAHMTNGARTIVGTGALDNIDLREDSEWRQTVQSGRGQLGAMVPKLGENLGTKLTGDNAIQHVRAVLGLGGMIRIPLWASGFWITLRTPSDADLLELERRLAEDKIEIGRRTYGALFNNECVFYDNAIYQFAMNHLFDSTLENKTDIAKKIKVQDLQSIAWGLACAIWPQGFQYARPVFNKDTGAFDTAKALLNVTKLQWIDTRSLTDRQVIHMTKIQPSSVSDDSLKLYSEQFARTQTKRYPISADDSVQIELNVPNLDEYFDAGTRWITDIVIANDKVFGIDQNARQRDDYLFNQTNATIMRQYAHWVARIVTLRDDGLGNVTERVIEDRPSIEALLNELSAHEDITKRYFEAVTMYIKESTISMIAVPTLTEEDEVGSLPNFPRLISLNAMETFFILLVQRTRRISER